MDSAGEAWIGGYTQSADFPLVHRLQSTLGARPIWESTDAGVTWTPIDNLPFAVPQVMAVDPRRPLRCTKPPATSEFSRAPGAKNVTTVAIDPVHTQILFAATAGTVYKSTDGAASWSAIDTPPFAVGRIEIDGQNTNILYEMGSNIRKSIDGGSTWTNVMFPAVLQSIALDPRVSGHLTPARSFSSAASSAQRSESLPLDQRLRRRYLDHAEFAPSGGEPRIARRSFHRSFHRV